MNDVDILASHINSLTKFSNNMVYTLHQHAAHISSFMKVMDQRTTNLMRGIQTNYQQITRLTNLFNTNFSEFQDSFSNISTVIADHVHKSSSIINSFTNLQNAVKSLVQGKITPFLIQETVLAQTLQQIERKLSKSYTQFFLINSTSTRASQLINTPAYLAVTSYHHKYATFLTAQLSDYTRNLPYIICSSNIPLTPVTVPNCMVALFSNNKNQTKDFYNFCFVPSILKSDMIELTYTSILVYNVKSLKIDCQDYKKSTSGCKFCIYDLPCKCSLLSENLVFTPKLVDCQKHIKNVSYPVN